MASSHTAFSSTDKEDHFTSPAIITGEEIAVAGWKTYFTTSHTQFKNYAQQFKTFSKEFLPPDANDSIFPLATTSRATMHHRAYSTDAVPTKLEVLYNDVSWHYETVLSDIKQHETFLSGSTNMLTINNKDQQFFVSTANAASKLATSLEKFTAGMLHELTTNVGMVESPIATHGVLQYIMARIQITVDNNLVQLQAAQTTLENSRNKIVAELERSRASANKPLRLTVGSNIHV